MSRRWRWVAVVVVLAVAAGAGTLYVVRRPTHTQRASTTPRPVIRASALTPVHAGQAGPTPTGVSAALRQAMTDAAFGGSLSGLVTDATTGRVLLDRAAGRAMTPASTVKVLTAAVALSTLGPAATLTTRVLRSGSTLYFQGGGDVTLLARPATPSAYPRPADIVELARATARGVGATPVTTLCADASRWTGPTAAPGWSPGYFTGGDIEVPSSLELDEGRLSRTSHVRAAHPVRSALATFAAALRDAGVTVRRATCLAVAPATSTAVAAVESPPMSALVTRMLTASDNDLAEALGRAIAISAGQPASFAGAAAAIRAGLDRLGLPTTGLRLLDASGLSRLDRASPATLVAVLRAAVSQPSLRPLLAGLPVAAATGTLDRRFRARATLAGAGVVRAKTGTLAGVNSLAGVVVDADGLLLTFAFFSDRAIAPSRTEAALDRLAAMLASCGCH